MNNQPLPYLLTKATVDRRHWPVRFIAFNFAVGFRLLRELVEVRDESQEFLRAGAWKAVRMSFLSERSHSILKRCVQRWLNVKYCKDFWSNPPVRNAKTTAASNWFTHPALHRARSRAEGVQSVHRSFEPSSSISSCVSQTAENCQLINRSLWASNTRLGAYRKENVGCKIWPGGDCDDLLHVLPLLGTCTHQGFSLAAKTHGQ